MSFKREGNFNPDSSHEHHKTLINEANAECQPNGHQPTIRTESETSDDGEYYFYNPETKKWLNDKDEDRGDDISNELKEKAYRYFWNNRNFIHRGIESGDEKGELLSEISFILKFLTGDEEMYDLLKIADTRWAERFVPEHTWSGGLSNDEYRTMGGTTAKHWVAERRVYISHYQIGSFSLPHDLVIGFREKEKEDEKLETKNIIAEKLFKHLMQVIEKHSADTYNVKQFLNNDDLLDQIRNLKQSKFTSLDQETLVPEDLMDFANNNLKIHYKDQELRDGWEVEVNNLLKASYDELEILKSLDRDYWDSVGYQLSPIYMRIKNETEDRPTIIDELNIILNDIQNHKQKLKIEKEEEIQNAKIRKIERKEFLPEIKKVLESIKPILSKIFDTQGSYNGFTGKTKYNNKLVAAYFEIENQINVSDIHDIETILKAVKILEIRIKQEKQERKDLLSRKHTDWQTEVGKEFLELKNREILSHVIIGNGEAHDNSGDHYRSGNILKVLKSGGGKFKFTENDKGDVVVRYHTRSNKLEGGHFILENGNYVLTKHDGIFIAEFSPLRDEDILLRVTGKVDEVFDQDIATLPESTLEGIVLPPMQGDKPKELKVEPAEKSIKQREVINDKELESARNEFEVLLEDIDAISFIVTNDKLTKIKTRINNRINLLETTSKNKIKKEIKKNKKSFEDLKKEITEDDWPEDWISRAKIAFNEAIPELQNNESNYSDDDLQDVVDVILDTDIPTAELKDMVVELYS